MMDSYNDASPSISIILPVYNGQPYLKESIDSMLGQTLGDFELIVINDGSSDDSESVIEKFHDPRIRYFRQRNRGLAATLNRGISLARGKFIARQDQDDVSFSTRFEKQHALLESDPNVGMVGTFAQIWEGNENSGRLLVHPADDVTLRFGLLFNNHFVHSSVMIRKSVLDDVGGYSEDRTRQPPEDYELWSRVARKYKVVNIPEVLMAYREVPSSMSRTGINPFVSNLVKISAENIAWASGRNIDSPEVVSIAKLVHCDYAGIPRTVDFPGMKSVLIESAENIARLSGMPASALENALNARLRLLRYRYFDYRSAGLLGKMMRSEIGVRAKRLMRNIFVGYRS